MPRSRRQLLGCRPDLREWRGSGRRARRRGDGHRDGGHEERHRNEVENPSEGHRIAPKSSINDVL
ncbi:hypothetical protein C791_5714 [Amycolatopsis azurea DSM 43854]|uniref:Uncharacterized protein n=1 Tax=Amycolatopsis azurea DSM 43854 TaxID=1238180 RepID=M2NQV7_9PSEU|nr:hypothetical protein C791_5714 [Amycolatopsis azurea DSM 43854]